MQERVISLLLLKSETLEDVWTSHCLELDVVSQGSSIEEALTAVLEAVHMVIEDDCEHGLDPFDRDAAPAEVFDLFDRVNRSKSRRRLAAFTAEERARLRVVVATTAVIVPIDEPCSRDVPLSTPDAWLIAAFDKYNIGPSSQRPH